MQIGIEMDILGQLDETFCARLYTERFESLSKHDVNTLFLVFGERFETGIGGMGREHKVDQL